MSTHESKAFDRARQFITHTLQQVTALVPSDVAEEVLHFLRHDEYEMAFEVLVLTLMEHPQPVGVDLAEALNVAKDLGMDGETESVYDDNFFDKLSTYATS